MADDDEAQREVRKRGTGYEEAAEEEAEEFTEEMRAIEKQLAARQEATQRARMELASLGLGRGGMLDDDLFGINASREALSAIDAIERLRKAPLSRWQKELLAAEEERSQATQSSSLAADSDSDDAGAGAGDGDEPARKRRRGVLATLGSESDEEVDPADAPNAILDPDGHAAFMDKLKRQQGRLERRQRALEVKHGRRSLEGDEDALGAVDLDLAAPLLRRASTTLTAGALGSSRSFSMRPSQPSEQSTLGSTLKASRLAATSSLSVAPTVSAKPKKTFVFQRDSEKSASGFPNAPGAAGSSTFDSFESVQARPAADANRGALKGKTGRSDLARAPSSLASIRNTMSASAFSTLSRAAPQSSLGSGSSSGNSSFSSPSGGKDLKRTSTLSSMLALAKAQKK
jgi:hypothetical protein